LSHDLVSWIRFEIASARARAAGVRAHRRPRLSRADKDEKNRGARLALKTLGLQERYMGEAIMENMEMKRPDSMDTKVLAPAF
jgi:ParB-like chromosome segregation protein Spo0J